MYNEHSFMHAVVSNYCTLLPLYVTECKSASVRCCMLLHYIFLVLLHMLFCATAIFWVIISNIIFVCYLILVYAYTLCLAITVSC